VTGTLTCSKDGLLAVVDKVSDEFERNSLFLSHMKYFLDRLMQTDISPLCPLEDGITALTIVESARLSDKRGSIVNLAEGVL